MSEHVWLYLSYSVLNAFEMSYGWAGATLRIGRYFGVNRNRFIFSCANKVWLFTKYPTLLNVCIGPAIWLMLNGRLTWPDYLVSALNAYVWWRFRNEGDDDWKKKLKDKAAGLVKVFRSRLVVVPQGAA